MYRQLLTGSSLLVVCMVTLFCGKSDPVQVSATLETDNDSVYIVVEGFASRFAFDDMQSIDTINNELEVGITMFTHRDTVLFSPDTTPRYVKIVSGESAKYLAVTYFEQSRRDEKKYLGLLREYDSFADEKTKLDFRFTYSSIDDMGLVELKQKYNLDSIAGDGNEVTRIMNLLAWANRIVPHDGEEDPSGIDPRNAINIIAMSERTGKGVNCRMMATLLNEAYLATGFKSRHITCMPYDKEDPDCHVINIVYSDSLKKWLYVDPTFCAYFMDTDSNLLNIEEVRLKLIAGEHVLIPDAINWNGVPKEKRGYRNYMAKNLFRFVCPVSSEFGYESKDTCAWVYLNPVGYDDELKETTDTSHKASRTYIDYHTGDKATFWALP